MTDFTKKGLWAPEVLLAEEADWGGNPTMGVFFGEGLADDFEGSGHRRFVHMRLRYRAADTQPTKVVDSWAPVELVSVENLIDRPDEDLLGWLRQTRRGPDTHHAYESARLQTADPHIAELLEVDVGEPYFFL
jgi:hypothetical protein